MSVFNVKKEVKNFGEAMDFMRGIMQKMNRGIMSGECWAIGSDVPEEKRARILNPQLHEIAFKIQEMSLVEDAPMSSFPFLKDVAALLAVEGYGMGDQYRADSSQTKQGEVEGSGDGTKVDSGITGAENAPQSFKEGEGSGKSAPWEANL